MSEESEGEDDEEADYMSNDDEGRHGNQMKGIGHRVTYPISRVFLQMCQYLLLRLRCISLKHRQHMYTATYISIFPWLQSTVPSINFIAHCLCRHLGTRVVSGSWDPIGSQGVQNRLDLTGHHRLVYISGVEVVMVMSTALELSSADLQHPQCRSYQLSRASIWI